MAEEEFDIQVAEQFKKQFQNHQTFIDLRKYLTLDIENEPWDLCTIDSREQLLAVNYFQQTLTLFDKELKVIKTINKINNLTFKSLSVATNQVDRLYVSDFSMNRIIVCNLEFDLITTVGYEGSSSNQFNGPSGVCYHDGFIYVCDYFNERIQKLSASTLEFSKSFDILMNAYHIKILGNTAAVRPDEETYIYFYNVEDFTIKSKFNERSGYICISNRCFYQFDYSTLKINCYDENGGEKPDIRIDGTDDINFDDWTCLTQFGNKLIICPGSSFKMIVIQKIETSNENIIQEVEEDNA